MFQIVRSTRIAPWKFPLRTFFSRSGVGIDNLNLSREQYATKNATSIESFKKRFLDSVKGDKAQIFTEDLRNMILAASTDEEINGVIEGLRKYNASKLKFTDFHFGSPLMRLLYIHNKTDLAMKLFMDESLKEVFRDAGSALVLMNKLIEDQRYDDAIKIFDYGCQRGFTTTTGRTFPSDVLMLAVETLYRQNTKESLAKLKDILGKIREQTSEINPRTAAFAALLAIRQGEPSFAMEILGAIRTQNLTTMRNIRAICYAELGRVEEAISLVHLMADQPPVDDDRRRVFPLVLEHIRQAVGKSNDADQKSRFEDLAKFVSKNNRLSPIDLFDFLNEPISRRSAVAQNRPGAQRETPAAAPRRPAPVYSPNKADRQTRRVDTTATSPIPQRVR